MKEKGNPGRSEAESGEDVIVYQETPHGGAGDCRPFIARSRSAGMNGTLPEHTECARVFP